jgi:hypothetical protein
MRAKRFTSKTEMKSEEAERQEKGYERNKSDLGLFS